MGLDNEIKIEYAKEVVDDWISGMDTADNVEDFLWSVSEGAEISEEDQQAVVQKVDEIIEDLRIYVSKNY